MVLFLLIKDKELKRK